MPRRLPLALALALVASLALAAAAGAAKVELKCGGKGAHNKDSAGTILCAAEPGKARTITGSVRDDAGKPVATRVTVTFSDWIPAAGGGYTIKEASTKTISSNPSGAFSLPVKAETKVSVEFAVGDEAAGVSGTSAQADVSRRLDVKLSKLGAGKVKLAVKGAAGKRLKLYVLDSSGYEIRGVPPKTTKSGSAAFNLGSRRGQFSYYVDAGVYTDLYWYEGRRSFRL